MKKTEEQKWLEEFIRSYSTSVELVKFKMPVIDCCALEFANESSCYDRMEYLDIFIADIRLKLYDFALERNSLYLRSSLRKMIKSMYGTYRNGKILIIFKDVPFYEPPPKHSIQKVFERLNMKVFAAKGMFNESEMGDLVAISLPSQKDNLDLLKIEVLIEASNEEKWDIVAVINDIKDTMEGRTEQHEPDNFIVRGVKYSDSCR